MITRSILDLLDENFFASKADETTAPLHNPANQSLTTNTQALDGIPLLPGLTAVFSSANQMLNNKVFFLSGESLISRSENIVLVRNGASAFRRLLLTNYQLLFIGRTEKVTISYSSLLLSPRSCFLFFFSYLSLFICFLLFSFLYFCCYVVCV